MKRSLLVTAFLAAMAGHAQFGPPRTIEETETLQPNVLALADLDGDGDNDLVSSSMEGRVGWSANDGDGSFAPPQWITTTAVQARGMDIADLDGDADVDVISASSWNDQVFWYENDGSGSFSEHLVAVADGTWCLEAVDLDGDGDSDILRTSPYDNINWYENDGSGNFGPASLVAASEAVYSAATADLDGDGDIDVLATNSLNDVVFWFANDGDGSFGPEQIVAAAVGGANHATADDIDGDGDDDVLSAAWNENTIAWYENDGTGAFGPQQVISSAVQYAHFVLTADVDGDADADVLSASSIDDKVAWYENDGSGNFGLQQVITTAAYWATSLTTGDADGDGDPDVFSTSWEDDKVAWYANDGSGGFGPQMVLTTSARQPSTMHAADVDGDGDNDLLMGLENVNDSRIVHYENLGGGTTGPQIELTGLVDVPRSLHTADLDGDGDLDLLSASFEDQKFAWYANDGSGTFGPQQVIAIIGSNAMSIRAVDLDGDGDQDVLGGANYGLFRYLNDGSGNFIALSAIAGNHSDVHPADVDGDGDEDHVSIGAGGALVWGANDGLGNFGTETVISVLNASWSIAVADLDNDGDVDALSSASADDMIAWHANDGAGNFGPQQVISILADNAWQVLTADIDMDGDNDVLSISHDDDKVAWYQNDGNGGFGPQLIIDGSVDMAWCATVTDLDGDGDPDLAAAGRGDCITTWYENHAESPYRIEGTAFMDADLNGSYGGLDAPFPYAPVTITPMLSTVMTGASGSYIAFVDTGSFALESSLPDPLWTLTTVPPVQSVQVTTLAPQVTGIDFGWAPAIDTSIVVPGFTLGSAPCGSTGYSWLSYLNQGTRIEQGIITLELDPLFTFLNSVPPPSVIVGNTITWDFDSLAWFEIGLINVEVELPTADSIGSSWTNTTTVTTVDSLGNTTGVFTLEQDQVVGCAYDPNDKQVEPQGYGVHGAVPIDTEWLTYTIRFQNTGTDTAYNVTIVDQLDDDLDRSSLQILGTSHDMTSLQVDADGEAIFRFGDIMLPDSNASVPASQGYLRYRIRPAQGADDGTVITNTASIIFDFNPAIVTNTVSNTLVDCELFHAEIHWHNMEYLVASAGAHYQWYLDGDSIVGANGQWLLVTAPGNYTVEVTNVYGCADVSDAYLVIITGQQEHDSPVLTAVPNPANDHVRLILPRPAVGDVVLYDATGAVVRRMTWPAGCTSLQLDLRALEEGIYFVELVMQEGRNTARVVRLR